MNRRRLEHILSAVCAPITAPFHEHRITRVITKIAGKAGLKVTADATGNLYVRSPGKLKSGAMALMAHMDHPGFEIAEVAGKKAKARFFGRVKKEYFPGAKVIIAPATGDGPPVAGTVLSPIVNGSGPVTGARLLTDQPVAIGDFGTWDMEPIDIKGERLRARAIDDLAGCAAILTTLIKLAESGNPGRAMGVFTRAEEAGFIGAIAMARAESLSRKLPVISLEASAIRPWARSGDGPVIRVGDAQSVFDPMLCAALDESATRLKKSSRNFNFQRALLDGGRCEATPLLTFGYSAAGLAFPLINYHNMARNNLLKPEEIAWSDYRNMVTLLEHLALDGIKCDQAKYREFWSTHLDRHEKYLQ